MSKKEIANLILEVLKLIISWQFLTFFVVFLLRSQIKNILSDLLKRLNKAPGGWEFSELKDVKEEVATLVNNYEMINEKSNYELKIDPYTIRLRHSSIKANGKYWNVRVWLDAPDDFLDRIKNIRYERHPTFKIRYFETNVKPFIDEFRCWGEFTIKAEITLKDGQKIRRQRYITLNIEN